MRGLKCRGLLGRLGDGGTRRGRSGALGEGDRGDRGDRAYGECKGGGDVNRGGELTNGD